MYYDSDSTVAGPSTRYTIRQKSVLDHLPQLKTDCIVCRDSLYPHHTVRLACGDVYCKSCLHSFLLRATKDESLFPPRCHRQPIGNAIIEANLNDAELSEYRNAELEFTSTNRIYCAVPECARFIPATQRDRDRASCAACGAVTCVHCKALSHPGGCLQDTARQQLLEYGVGQNWKTCFGCGEMVEKENGCNHMT